MDKIQSRSFSTARERSEFIAKHLRRYTEVTPREHLDIHEYYLTEQPASEHTFECPRVFVVTYREATEQF